MPVAAVPQVDTPGKKLLVGIAITYVVLVLVLPTANVFIQVAPWFTSL